MSGISERSGSHKEILFHPATIRVRHQGFTLLELLIVLVLIGITLGVVVVQLLPSKQSLVMDEAQRLALLLDNATLEGRVNGQPLAWSAEKGGYNFWKKNEFGEWVPFEGEGMFRSRALPEGINITEITVEDQPLKPGVKMYLGASAFDTPFHIQLTMENINASVLGKSNGTILAKMDSQN